MNAVTQMNIAQLMQESQVKFGTSGARGLVSDMTDQVCYTYTLAFILYLEKTQQIQQISNNSKIVLAGDLRKSTPRILNACAKAIIDSGYQVINAGLIPTPAVALYGLKYQCPAIMVTGSHIPDDRNGIKFYKLAGEILKADEEIIQQLTLTNNTQLFDQSGAFLEGCDVLPAVDNTALDDYFSRYLELFPKNAFAGKKIGIYQHSGVAREIIVQLLDKLGAETVKLGFSDDFVPVDTEAVREQDCQLAKQWSVEHQLDAIMSTDGDADRPLLSDEDGNWLRGDIVGLLCAQYLQIDHLVAPVSVNSCVEKSKLFVDVKYTRIGSPYVIEAMNHYVEDHYASVAGYEANGGFLLATPMRKNNVILSALPTRDAIIVLLSVLHMSIEKNCSMSHLLKQLPARTTYSDRIKNISPETSQQLLSRYSQSDEAQNKQLLETDFSDFGAVKSINHLDGLRVMFENDDIIHFRASGNAPEFRCYSESDSLAQAQKINKIALDTILSLS